MSYSVMVRLCNQQLRHAKKKGLPGWAERHVTRGLDKAAYFRSKCGTGKDYRPQSYARAVSEVLAVRDVLFSFLCDEVVNARRAT